MSVGNYRIAMPVMVFSLKTEREIFEDIEVGAREAQHPQGAYKPDGRKLAIVNCPCQYCVGEFMRREMERLEGRVWSDGLLS